MNKEHEKGAEEKGVGKIKESAGRITGNTKLENEGKVDQVKGAMHTAVGDAKDSVKEAFKRR
jgi:uncharacterized protein YjbJ (UPF0337 family)